MSRAHRRGKATPGGRGTAIWPAWALGLLLGLPLLQGCASRESRVAALEGADPIDRAEAFVALGHRAEWEEDVRGLLADKALRALGAADPKAPLDGDEAVYVRLVAVRVLARLADKGVRTRDVAIALTRHIAVDARRSEVDFWVRIESVECLSTLLSGPGSRYLEDDVRTAAVAALSGALDMERESDKDVRIHAAREMAALKPRGKVPLDALVAALSDETPDVRAHALRALLVVAGGDHGPTKQDWERWARSEAERSEGR